MVFASLFCMGAISIKINAEILHFVIEENGNFPGNRLPVLVYRNVLLHDQGDDIAPGECEKILLANNWGNNWTDSIFNFNHYHSNTHEVLCINSGSVKVLLGGPGGRKETLGTGDVIILPAGVAHKKINASGDFSCVGGYPAGKNYDMNVGKCDEKEQAANVPLVNIPSQDPIFGKNGPLFDFWK